MDTLTRKRQAAAFLGLPADLADTLEGETEREIQDSAARLAAALEQEKTKAKAAAKATAKTQSFSADGGAEKAW